MQAIQFEIHPPANADEVAGNIAHAMSLGLPEADAEPIRTLHLIANGPSARGLIIPKIPGDTLCVNGAIKLFTDAGCQPTYWAACDPQALVADFIPDDPPRDTIYLVASKCHPSVFQRLRGRDVRLWHIDDHPVPQKAVRRVPCASSVTLVAMSLMRRLGYRHFEVFGWDACYSGLVHHASEPALNCYPDGAVDFCVGATQVHEDREGKDAFEGGRWFKTTASWAAEAHDAITQTHFADYSVNVHGDGMIAAVISNKTLIR